jgi:hypothetical protein
MNKERTFEDLLKEFHANNYTGTDDDMPDHYENWVTEMDVDRLIEIADIFGKEMYLRGKSEVLDQWGKALKNL